MMNLLCFASSKNPQNETLKEFLLCRLGNGYTIS